MLAIRVSVLSVARLLTALSLFGLRRRRAVFLPCACFSHTARLPFGFFSHAFSAMASFWAFVSDLSLIVFPSPCQESARPVSMRMMSLPTRRLGRGRGAERFDPIFGRGQCLNRAFCCARSARRAHRVGVGAPWLQGYTRAVQVETDALINEGARSNPLGNG